jgi:hypothetical protein
MMNVSVDISVLCADGSAIGMISGDLNVVGVPPQGSLITFSKPNAGIDYVNIDGFSGRLEVKNIVFTPSTEREPELLLILEDITVKNGDDGRKIMKYFEDGFGLFSYEYD